VTTRKALRQALGPRPAPAPRKARPPVYGQDVMGALATVWAVMDAPAGQRMATFLPESVPDLGPVGSWTSNARAPRSSARLSAATIERRLAAERKRLELKRRSPTKIGSLPKSQIPIRTWADRIGRRRGPPDIDLVGHEGGDSHGQFAQPLTATNVFDGWTETKTTRNKAQKWVFAARVDLRPAFPFPIRGIDSEGGSEFINASLPPYCEQEQVTFTRSRAGRMRDGAHVEQKNWSVCRCAARSANTPTTPPELDLLKAVYALRRLQTNFSPSRSWWRSTGAKMTKRYDNRTDALPACPGLRTRPEDGRDHPDPPLQAAQPGPDPP